MLNLGTIYGAATGGFGGFAYGLIEGPYMRETVAILDSIGTPILGLAPIVAMGPLGVLCLFGLAIGACVGSVVHGRSRW